MPMLSLLITSKVLEDIQKIKLYAEKNRVNIRTLEKMEHFGEPDYNGPPPAGINPENTLKIYDSLHIFYYKIAFSIEEMGSKDGKESIWVRHFSASTSFKDSPNDFILDFLPLLDFKSKNKKELYIKNIPPVIHILEPVDTTWEELRI